MCADERRHIEAYHLLVRLFEIIHIDNMKILKALIYSKDDLPLVDGLSKKRVCLESHLIYIFFFIFFSCGTFGFGKINGKGG